MSEPTVFISSTYEDLKYVREVVDSFVDMLGYTATRFDTGDIPFSSEVPLDKACHDEVGRADIFLLIIGRRYGALTTTNATSDEKQISITRSEFRCAIEHKIKIYVFVDKHTKYRYDSYKEGKYTNDLTTEEKGLFTFLQEIYDHGKLYAKDYETIHDIQNWLKKQWAGAFKKYITNERKYELRKLSERKINAYKMFFFRRNIGLSIEDLEQRTKISSEKLRKLESITRTAQHSISDISCFGSCTYDEAQKIADALNCGLHNIVAGSPDDFLSQIMLYYKKYKGKPIKKGSVDNNYKLPFKTKAVVFDFDGTLTISDNEYTTWEELWIKLGYNVNECADYHDQYNNGKITHGKWCAITESKFKERNLTISQVEEVAAKIRLIDGVSELLRSLDDSGIDVYIVSGSIDVIIQKVLGSTKFSFVDIKSNVMRFKEDGSLKGIIGTDYDFEGKADYIKQLIQRKGYMPYEVLFVGNSLNDTYVHESGAITVCVNPKLTDPESRIEWDYFVRFTKNILDVKQFINF